MKIGNYKVTSFVTSRFSLDGGSIFGIIPKSMWGKEAVPDKKNRILRIKRYQAEFQYHFRGFVLS